MSFEQHRKDCFTPSEQQQPLIGSQPWKVRGSYDNHDRTSRNTEDPCVRLCDTKKGIGALCDMHASHAWTGCGSHDWCCANSPDYHSWAGPSSLQNIGGPCVPQSPCTDMQQESVRLSPCYATHQVQLHIILPYQCTCLRVSCFTAFVIAALLASNASLANGPQNLKRQVEATPCAVINLAQIESSWWWYMAIIAVMWGNTFGAAFALTQQRTCVRICSLFICAEVKKHIIHFVTRQRERVCKFTSKSFWHHGTVGNICAEQTRNRSWAWQCSMAQQTCEIVSD